MEIKRTINQDNGDFVYALNTKDVDEISQVGCILNQEELKQQNEIFNMMIENNYQLQVNALTDEYLSLIQRLKELNYYIEKDGIITFGPMYLINQEIDDLNLPRCEICNLYGTIGIYCPKEDCYTFYHKTCLKRMGRDSHTCAKCKTHLNYSN